MDRDEEKKWREKFRACSYREGNVREILRASKMYDKIAEYVTQTKCGLPKAVDTESSSYLY